MGWGNPEPYAELKRHARQVAILQTDNAILRSKLKTADVELAAAQGADCEALGMHTGAYERWCPVCGTCSCGADPINACPVHREGSGHDTTETN